MIRTSNFARCFFKCSNRHYLGWITFLMFILQAFGAIAQVPSISYTTPTGFLRNLAATPLSPVNSGGGVAARTYRDVTTFVSSALNGPRGMVSDKFGNIYVTERADNVISKITTAGTVSVLVSGLTDPKGITINTSTGDLYFTSSNSIYKIPNTNNANYSSSDASVGAPTYSWTSTTSNLVAGGGATSGTTEGSAGSALFNTPAGITMAPDNTYLLVAEFGSHRIRKVMLNDASTSTFAGATNASSGTTDNTSTTLARFDSPEDVVMSSDGSKVYVSEWGNSSTKYHRIRKIESGQVTTLAGPSSGTSYLGYTDGTGSAARFERPRGMALDAAGNLYVVEGNNNAVRRITPAGVVSNMAGSTAGGYNGTTTGSTNGVGTAARFDAPQGITLGADNYLYVAENTGDRIRRISLDGYTISPALPTGLSMATTSGVISGTPTTVTAAADYVVTAYNSSGSSAFTVNLAVLEPPSITTTTATSITGTGATAGGNVTSEGGSAVSAKGVVWSTSALPTVALATITTDGSGTGSFTSTITGLSPNTTYYYRAYATTNAGTVYGSQLSFTTLQVAPSISYPSASYTLVRNAAMTPIVITNAGGTPDKAQVSRLAGSGSAWFANGIGTAASFAYPFGVWADATENLYVSDASNHRIRKINLATGEVTTLAGNGSRALADGSATSASFQVPNFIIGDGAGNLYITDRDNHAIRKIVISSGTVSTIAGNGSYGSANGTGAAARFSSPYGIAINGSGDLVISDFSNGLIRKSTTGGVVSTFAGTGYSGAVNGIGTAASFNGPAGLGADAAGNIYAVDHLNNLIRKITPGASVTTLAGSGAEGSADGSGTSASFKQPIGLAVGPNGNIYVADYGGLRIRSITPSGLVTTVAGTGTIGNTDGTVTNARFGNPFGIAVDASENIYFSDYAYSVIRIIAPYRISPALPAGLFFDARTGTIRGTPTTAQAAKTYTVYSQNSAGTGQTTITIAIAAPPTISMGTASNITANSATLKGTVNANGGATTTLTIKYATSQTDVDAGNGTSLTVSPTSVSGNTATSVSAVIASGLTANTTYYFRVSATNAAGTTNGSTSSFTTQDAPPSISYSGSPITLSKGSAITTTIGPVNAGGEVQPMQVSTIAGSGNALFADGVGTQASFNQPRAIAIGSNGILYVADGNNQRIRKLDPVTREVTTLAGTGTPGYADGAAASASFYLPSGIAIDGSDNLYVSDYFNHRIRKIDASTLQVTTLAGSGNGAFANGNGTAASFSYPFGIAVDASQQVYVGDESNHRVRQISSTGNVTTLAGSGNGTFANGTGSAASFYFPQGVAVDGSGTVYVADYGNQLIRKITSSGAVTTLVANTTAQPIYAPSGIALDNNGNLYMTGASSNRVLKIVIATGQVIPLAGRLSNGFADGTGTDAAFNYPYGVAVDASGNLFIADGDNNRIRKISRYAISPALPAGLSFNTATGEITGNPTELSPATTYTVTASNGGGTSTATFSLEVSSSMLTTDVADITATTATAGGTVGVFSGITERGVVYSTAAGPDITDGTDTKIPHTSATTGVFTQNLTGLAANTTYYIRAYVIHSGGTTYGSEKSFKTNRTMTMADLPKTYGDANFALTPPTSNSTGAWTYASGTTSVATIIGSTVTIVGAGSSIITATQAAAGAYAGTSLNFTLTVNKATPTITLTVPTTTALNQVTGANTINVSGTSSDGQTVTMSIVSGGATGTLTATGTPGQFTLSNVSSSGIITFEGSVSGNSNMNAVAKQAAMDVTLINQAITFNPTTPLTYTSGMSLTLSATGGGSGNPVTFDVLSGPANNGGTNGSTPSVTGPGTIVVKASQASSGTHNAAPDVTRSIVVNAAAPIITSFTPTSATEGEVVTITGQYFQNVSAVSFGGTAATSFNVVNSTTITTVLGAGRTGAVSVTTTGGTDTEPGFRYKALWTGATNAFNSTGNWSGGRVPLTDDDIVFSPTAASDLELDGDKIVGHVNFNGSGRSLKLGTHNLTIKGNLTMPGNITGTGRVIMNGGAVQTIIGGGEIPDLEIKNSNGVTIDGSGDELTVSGTLRSSSGTLTTNGKLRLKSNSGGTARVGQVSGAITGNVIAERYVQRNENSDGTGRAWRLVSIPVTGTGTLRDFFMNGRDGQDLTLSASRDAETGNSGTPIIGHNYATASEANNAPDRGFDWIGVANSVSSLRYYTGDATGGSFASENVPTMTTTYGAAAQGYMVFARGDRKLDFPSATSSGATTFRSMGSLKTGNQTVSIAPASTSKFTLVGNPYMSVLDLSLLHGTNSAVINPSFWIWDANMAGTNNQGGYVNVYLSGSQWVTNTGTYIDPQLIESGMAFFVEPATSLATATDLTIMETHKSAAASAGLSPFSTDQPDDHGRMYVRLERADNKGQRQLIDGVMADFHASFKTTLGDQSDREKLRNVISRGAIWLKTDQKILSSEGLPWPTNVKCSIPLYMSGVGDQTLIVRVDPRGMRDRYVKAWLKDNVLKRQVELNMSAPTDYDFIGTGSAAWDSTRFEIVYLEAGRPSTGVTLEPDDAAEQPSVKLYPNPAKSADVKLSLRAMAPGTYSVHVLDMTGRLVAMRTLDHRSLNGEYRILEGRLLSPGTYIIKLSNQNKQPKETLRLVVDQ